MAKLPASHVGRIAVFRALNIGDLLCAIPALRALRHAYPDAHITQIGLPSMAEFARRFPMYIDAFVSFPGAPGLPEQPFDLNDFLSFLEREAEADYDLVLQMHGKGSITNPVVAMFATGRIGGYYEAGEFCPDEELCMPCPEGEPEIERHLQLMDFLGIQRQGAHLEFPLTEHDCKAAEQLRKANGFNARPYVCIHPGARDHRRWWAPEKFAQVADRLARKGPQVVFTGSESELPIVERVRREMQLPSVNLAGRTDLGSLAALIANAELLLSNDTGVSHLAAATATPSVVIFLASDPRRWAPLDSKLHLRVMPEEAKDASLVMSRAERALAGVPRKNTRGAEDHECKSH